MELILQLAQAEDPSSVPSISEKKDPSQPPAGAVSEGGVSNSIKELHALEELEKELGLDDLNLLVSNSSTASGKVAKNSSTAHHNNGSESKQEDGKGNAVDAEEVSASVLPSSTPSVSVKAVVQEDDDNLDELEKYLQSLAT